MKKLSSHLIALFFAVIPVIFSSCEEDPEEPVPSPPVLSGVYIVNEGAFNAGNGTISFKSTDSSYYNADIYKSVNNEPLGDVVQSMSIYNRMGYICVNNSQKLVVVDMVDFKKKAVIPAGQPRYFLGFDSDGFLTDWGNNTVKVIDLVTNSIKIEVICGNGPEQMLGYSQSLYVCNSGGFGTDSTLTVINVNNYVKTDTITVGVNPNSIILDHNNKIWVLCNGTTGPDFTPGTADDIGGKLVQINPADNSIIKSFDFAQDQHPLKLYTDVGGETLYFLQGTSSYTGAVMKMNINATGLPSTPLINREFYGLGIETINKDIFCGVPSFAVNSYVLRYRNDGTFADSTEVGIGPNGFVFYQ